MIKEIVDIGKVSDELASVFTFKGLPNYYVKITFECGGEDFKLCQDGSIQHESNIEEYLRFRVHRGKNGSSLYFFPTSFIVTKDELTTKKQELIKKIQSGKSKVSTFLENEKDKNIKMFLEKLSDAIVNNLDYILDLAKDGMDKIDASKSKDDKKSKSSEIAVVVNIENSKIDENVIFKIFQSIEFEGYAEKFIAGSGKEKEHVKGICNLTQKEDFLYYPTGSFYYPFSTDKVNVKYDLIDDKNLFLLSKNAYIDFLTGRRFLEGYNSFYFMGMSSYITATSLDSGVLKEFQDDIRDSKSDLESLLDLIGKAETYSNKLLINFYFYEIKKGAGGTKDVIEYIKDVIPTRLVQNVDLFYEIKKFFEKQFNRELKNYDWQRHISYIYNKDSYKKFRTALFRKIALEDKIEKEQLLLFINDKMQNGINKDSNNTARYYYGDVFRHYIFLNWITKINKGETKMSEAEKQELFKGKTYEERLEYFLKTGNLVKDSPSMRVGVCIGLSIKILGWEITNYDKKVLAYASRRIERNNLGSLQIFVNEIFAKTQLHKYEQLHRVNIKFAGLELTSISNGASNISDSLFDKDKFIFGLFLGSELYGRLKSEKDPIDETVKEESEDISESNQGDDDE
jgi:hypothetical protein